jgi:hypothetical protein
MAQISPEEFAIHLSDYVASVHKCSPNEEVDAKFYVRHKGDIKQVPYCVPTDIRRHRAKFSGHGDLALGICAPLLHGVLNSQK